MLKKIKNILSFILSVFFLILHIFSNTYAANYKLPFNLECKGAYLFNVDTNTVVYEKNKDLKIDPASLVKVMTAIIVLEKVKDIDNMTACAKSYIFDELYGQNGTTAGIVKGETLTIRQLLQCMLTQSACEAAMILADAIFPDNIKAFIDMMNLKAKNLGAKNTFFTNPHGLYDDGQYTTAYDMFLITKYAMELPAFMDIVSETSHTITKTNKRDSFDIYTTIEPMKKSSKYYYPPIRGIKTGTKNSGRSFVSSATKDGFTYICCIMGAPYKNKKTNKVISGNKAFEDTINLYKWAFENFNIKNIIDCNIPITEVKLKYVFNKDHLKISTKKNISALIAKDVDISNIKISYNLPNQVYAPIKKGDIIGSAILSLDNNVITKADLVSFETVKKNWFLYIIDNISLFFNFLIFKIIGFFIIILLIIILIYISKKRNMKKKYKTKRSKKNKLFR